MAIHPDANSLTIEAVEEYLFIANHCITTKKKDGGIYGYPATLLLFCVIEALGKSLCIGKHPFRILKESAFGCKLSNVQIDNLENWYRHKLAHRAMIAPGTCLSPEDGEPFTFELDEPVLIRVKSLYSLVRNAWDQVDKDRLNSVLKPEMNPEIKRPIDLSGASMAVPVTASGSPYTPPPWKK